MPFVIKCPGCKQKIKWLVDDPPEDCPACGYRIASDRADDDIPMPNILTLANRSVDGVYKMMEKSSEDRVYAAAEQAGCDPADMAGLKITNLRDNMKHGDIAAMPVVNDLTKHMDAMRARNPNTHVGFGADHSAGVEFAAGAATGRIADGIPGSIMPRRGAQVGTLLTSGHGSKAAEVLQNSYMSKGYLR